MEVYERQNDSWRKYQIMLDIFNKNVSSFTTVGSKEPKENGHIFQSHEKEYNNEFRSPIILLFIYLFYYFIFIHIIYL